MPPRGVHRGILLEAMHVDAEPHRGLRWIALATRAEFGPRSAEPEDLGVHCLTCTGDDTRRDGWGLVESTRASRFLEKNVVPRREFYANCGIAR